MSKRDGKIEFTEKELEFFRRKKKKKTWKEDEERKEKRKRNPVCVNCNCQRLSGVYRKIRGEEQWWCISCIRAIAYGSDNQEIMIPKKQLIVLPIRRR